MLNFMLFLVVSICTICIKYMFLPSQSEYHSQLKFTADDAPFCLATICLKHPPLFLAPSTRNLPSKQTHFARITFLLVYSKLEHHTAATYSACLAPKRANVTFFKILPQSRTILRVLFFYSELSEYTAATYSVEAQISCKFSRQQLCVSDMFVKFAKICKFVKILPKLCR